MPSDTTKNSDRVAPLAVLQSGMDCKLRFFIENRSSHDVTIDQISFPALGPKGGSGAIATRLNPVDVRATGPAPDEGDAIWTVDDLLEAGNERYYELTVEFRPDGCTPEGGALFFSSWPVVTVGFRAMTITASPSATAVGFRGTELSSCDT